MKMTCKTSLFTARLRLLSPQYKIDFYSVFSAFSSAYRITVEPLFRGHPWDQGKCPLNGGWAGVC